MKNQTFLLLLIASLTIFVGCNRSDAPLEYLRQPNLNPYFVNVDISQPVLNERFRIGESLDLKIIFSRDAPNKIVHNYRVEILNEQREPIMEIDRKSPNEQGFVIFDKKNAFMPTLPGLYIVRGISTDGSGENPNVGEQPFIIE